MNSVNSVATSGVSCIGFSTGARGISSVLLHIFRKDTGKVPEGQILAAEERWVDFTTRMDARHRVPPRAAGHDAP